MIEDNPHCFRWTEERTEELKALFQSQEFSTLQIARKFGTTKNSVCSKIHRMGWAYSGRRPDKLGKPKQVPPPPRLKVPKPHPVVRSSFNPSTPKPEIHLVADNTSPLVRDGRDYIVGRPLELRGPHQCAYPLGDRPPYLFCCAPTADGPYCPAHHRRCTILEKRTA